MQDFSYRRHRFPPSIIQHAVWLYFGFPLGYRDVEDLLAERGIDVRYEAVRRWALRFGSAYAHKLAQALSCMDAPAEVLRCISFRRSVADRVSAPYKHRTAALT